MTDAIITIRTTRPDLLEELLVRIREFERQHPDDIHLMVSIDSPESTKQAVETMMRRLGLPHINWFPFQ